MEQKQRWAEVVAPRGLCHLNGIGQIVIPNIEGQMLDLKVAQFVLKFGQKVEKAIFNLKLTFFIKSQNVTLHLGFFCARETIAQKATKYLGVFARNFFAKNFQKSVNLVTLGPNDISSRTSERPISFN